MTCYLKTIQNKEQNLTHYNSQSSFFFWDLTGNVLIWLKYWLLFIFIPHILQPLKLSAYKWIMQVWFQWSWAAYKGFHSTAVQFKWYIIVHLYKLFLLIVINKHQLSYMLSSSFSFLLERKYFCWHAAAIHSVLSTVPHH